MPSVVPIRVARDFLAWYEDSLPGFREAARQLANYLQSLLSAENLSLHGVSARAKGPESVSAKLLRKQYAAPRSQLTDRIAARVIVYHASDVDRVASLLRSRLQVRERGSVDKRHALGLREFGYRSYHLIARLLPKDSARPEYRVLRNQVFEIQIRSLLEHVWAEIEHGVVYKSGANFPPELKRRFAALAGVLELLEHEFQQLIHARHGLIDTALQDLRAGPKAQQSLDVPYALALLELRRANGRSFRRAIAEGEPFPPGIEQRFVLAFALAGIRTVGALDRALASPANARLRRHYAAAEGVPEEELSHLAVLAVVLANRRRALLDVYFPEFRADASLSDALADRKR